MIVCVLFLSVSLGVSPLSLSSFLCCSLSDRSLFSSVLLLLFPDSSLRVPSPLAIVGLSDIGFLTLYARGLTDIVHKGFGSRPPRTEHK